MQWQGASRSCYSEEHLDPQGNQYCYKNAHLGHQIGTALWCYVLEKIADIYFNMSEAHFHHQVARQGHQWGIVTKSKERSFLPNRPYRASGVGQNILSWSQHHTDLGTHLYKKRGLLRNIWRYDTKNELKRWWNNQEVRTKFNRRTILMTFKRERVSKRRKRLALFKLTI